MKTFKYALLMLCAIVTFSCKDNEASGSNKEMEQLTSNDQKDYLVQVGKQLINCFNSQDQKSLADLTNGLYDKYQNYNWDDSFDSIDTFIEGQYESFFYAPKHLVAIASGKSMPSATQDVIVFRFGTDSYTFNVDEQNQTINIAKSTDGACHIYFKDNNGTNCEVKVWGEGTETPHSYTYKDGDITKTITAYIPANIHMFLKQGNQELVSYNIAFDTNEKDYVKTSITASVLNISWNFDANITTENGSAAFILRYNGNTIVSATANLPKYQLIAKDTNTDWEDWIELYEDRYETLLGQVGSGEGKLDILGKVQVKAQVSNGANLYDAIKAWDNKYANGNYNYWWERPEYTLIAQQELCDIYNNNTKLALYFDNTITEQAKVLMQPYSEERTVWYWNGSEYQNKIVTTYDSEPVLFFPKDATSYAFADYFGASKFNILIDMAEDLCNSYMHLLSSDITGLEDGDKIEFD